MVWHFPPSACVHMTHDTWKMESKCEESERKFAFFFFFLGSNQGIDYGKRKNSMEGGKEKKRKEKKKKKGKEKKKRKEERKERRGKQKRRGKIHVWRRKGK